MSDRPPELEDEDIDMGEPVTDTLAAALRLVSAVRASGVPVLVGHHRRHNPLLKAAKDLVNQLKQNY